MRKQKMKNLCLLILAITLNISLVFDLYGANLAIVDFSDQWTKVTGLKDTLDQFKIDYDDYTKQIESGNLKFTDENKAFFIGSMVTNSSTLHQGLDKNKKVIQEFVKRGGLVMEPTQADQNEANVDWLPEGLVCVRSDPDRPDIKIKNKKHLLFQVPHKLTEKDFQKWGHQGWPTVWEVISSQKGFTVIMESQGDPVIMEAKYGEGKFVMMSLAPDKYHVVGNDKHTKQKAGMFMENILEAFVLSKPWTVKPNGKLSTRWAHLKMHR